MRKLIVLAALAVSLIAPSGVFAAGPAVSAPETLTIAQIYVLSNVPATVAYVATQGQTTVAWATPELQVVTFGGSAVETLTMGLSDFSGPNQILKQQRKVYATGQQSGVSNTLGGSHASPLSGQASMVVASEGAPILAGASISVGLGINLGGTEPVGTYSGTVTFSIN